jgi:hypothetical protein
MRLHSIRFAALLAVCVLGSHWAGAQVDRRGHEGTHNTSNSGGKKGSNNKGKIEGTKWTSLEFTAKGKKVPADSVRFEFAKDGKLTYWILDKPYRGVYTLGDGDIVTLDLDEPLAGSKKHIQTIIIKDDSLRLIDTDKTELKFKKDK